jgi:phage repressor protein C with HTH and peptisase S24 domain
MSSMPIRNVPRARGAGGDQAGFVARLQLVVEQWPSADRLAKAAGVSPSAFRKWLKGAAEPNRNRLVALAEATGVSLAWLAQGEGPQPDLTNLAAQAHAAQSPRPAAHISAAQFLLVPKHPDAAAAGSGHPVTGGPHEFVGFRHDWIRATLGRDPADLILQVAVGESMEPHIRDGDLLLVDTADQGFAQFGVYVVRARGECLVKRVQRKFDGSLILISDNTAYQPELISAELAKEIHVVGRVVWRGGKI